MNASCSSQDDFETAFDDARRRLREAVHAVCSPRLEWPARVAAAIYAVLDFAVSDPDAIGVLTRDSLLHRPHGPDRYLDLLGGFAAMLRAEAPLDPQRPWSTEEALVGGIAMTITDHLGDRPGRLLETGPELVELTLRPYLGREEARRAARALPD